jgi:pimeloyl-ACP methyl ester carboxylesterase
MIARTHVDVGGRRLALTAAGVGNPVVILEAGLEYGADAWVAVQPAVAAFTRVVSYDRAGIGASTPAPTPRSTRDMVADLRALLETAAIAPPYVLVGHSIGGLTARLYAHLYPREVAGLVLVDATHPDQWDRWLEGLPPAEAGEHEILTRMRQRPWDDPGQNPEGFDVRASIAQARAVTSLGDLPLVVLTAGSPRQYADIPPPLAAHMARVKPELHRDLSRLSTNSRLVIAERSGHFIHQDQPDLVIDAIRRMVDEARRQ